MRRNKTKHTTKKHEKTKKEKQKPKKTKQSLGKETCYFTPSQPVQFVINSEAVNRNGFG